MRFENIPEKLKVYYNGNITVSDYLSRQDTLPGINGIILLYDTFKGRRLKPKHILAAVDSAVEAGDTDMPEGLDNILAELRLSMITSCNIIDQDGVSLRLKQHKLLLEAKSIVWHHILTNIVNDLNLKSGLEMAVNGLNRFNYNHGGRWCRICYAIKSKKDLISWLNRNVAISIINTMSDFEFVPLVRYPDKLKQEYKKFKYEHPEANDADLAY